MEEKQPDEIVKAHNAPVSQLLTQAVDAIRAEGGVDWRCVNCKASGVLPYGAHAKMFRSGHQKVADAANTGEDYENGPPWLPCGIELPKCANCTIKPRLPSEN